MLRSPLTVVAALSLALAAPGAARSQAIDPQPGAFASLQSASASPVSIAFDGRAARVAAFDVPVSGATPAARARAFLSTYAGLYDQTSAADQSLTVRQVRTLGGLQIVSLGQSYRGVPVYGAQVNVGLDPGDATGIPRARLTTGALLPDLQLEAGLDTTPTVSPDACVAAVQTALARPGAPALAEPKLWVYDARILGGAAEPHLVWAVTLGGGTPTQALCDAHDAAIVFQQPFAQDGVGLAGFDLIDYDANGNNSNLSCYAFSTRVSIGDESGIFQGFQTAENIAEWWHIRNTYLFFHDTFGRHSWDGKDLPVILNMHAGVDNAQYSTSCNQMELRDGWASFDVTVHEATHGVIHFTSDLVYAYGPGALNESYADTMAVVADSADWTLGEDRSGGGGAIRNFKDPPKLGKPDRMSLYAYTPNNKAGDWGGVHYNSSIVNKAHYLEATGDAFNGTPGFPGMGRFKLGWLSYYAMQIVPQNANFADARATEIFAAQFLVSKGLFGFTNTDVCAVRNAFHAVEIGASDLDCDGIDDNLQDADGDGRPDGADNCPSKFNPDQKDWDHDGVGDYCDVDFDNDGVPDGKDNCHDVKNWNQANNDGDAFGDACDPDDDNDGVDDALDNCPLAYNPPPQLDGNHNGSGDACDPDYDGDGFYVESDNCTFVFNPTQLDSDGDGLGDACDRCPAVADWTHAYLTPFPPGSTPQPYQPDSDGDGTPDACDASDFGLATFTLGGAPLNGLTIFSPGSGVHGASLDGPPGAVVRFPIPVCVAGADPSPSELVEFQFAMLPDSVDAAVLDDAGRRVATALPSGPGSELRGFRFRPDCTSAHTLQLILGPTFAGPVGFTAQSALVAETESDPWASTPPSGVAPPPPIPDADADGVSDDVDVCPVIGDPEQDDADADGVGDACDSCTNAPNPRVGPDAATYLAANPWATLTGGQRDDDHDGFGNACDAKFASGALVGTGDLLQFRASAGRNRAGDTCGTSGARPCAIFDLDESGLLIGTADLLRFRLLNGKLPGPKCAACPLACQAGAQGSCGSPP